MAILTRINVQLLHFILMIKDENLANKKTCIEIFMFDKNLLYLNLPVFEIKRMHNKKSHFTFQQQYMKMLLTAMNISSSRNLFFILSLILENKNGKFLTIFLKLLNYSVKHFTPAK